MLASYNEQILLRLSTRCEREPVYLFFTRDPYLVS